MRKRHRLHRLIADARVLGRAINRHTGSNRAAHQREADGYQERYLVGPLRKNHGNLKSPAGISPADAGEWLIIRAPRARKVCEKFHVVRESKLLEANFIALYPLENTDHEAIHDPWEKTIDNWPCSILHEPDQSQNLPSAWLRP